MAFINPARLLELNKDKGEEMGARAVGGVQPAFNAANMAIGRVSSGESDYGEGQSAVNQADAKLKALRSMGGMQAAIGPQASALDAALAGRSQAAGNAYSQMADFQKRYGEAQQQGQAVNDARAARQRALQSFQQMTGAADEAYGRQQADAAAKRQAQSDGIAQSNYEARVAAQNRRRMNQRNVFDWLGR